MLRRHGRSVARALGAGDRTAQLLARMAPMAVVVLAIVAVLLLPQATAGVALAGSIDLREGFDFDAPWRAPLAVWQALAGPALLLGLVGYVESLAVAEALAARRGETVQPRRELFGLAAANVAAGVSGGMPVTGGFARSMVNFDAGARTRMAGVWTAAFMAVAVLLLGGVLGWLPKAVLAVTIIVAVLSLLEWKPFAKAWRYSRVEFVLMAVVAVLTVLLGVEQALLAGVLLSAAILMQRTARPHWAEVGRLPGTEVFRNVKRFQVQTHAHVLAVRVDESLLFTNSRWLAEMFAPAHQQRPALRHVVLMMSGVNDIDLSGLEALMHINRHLHAQGVTLHLSELKGPVNDRLQRAGLDDWLTGSVFRTQHDADLALREQG
jgi:SulP family sulfate permease